NQGGLDIRTASNYIVLSDGDGNPRGIFDSDGDYIVGTTSATATAYSKSLSAAKTHIYSVLSANSNSTAFANQRTALFVDADTSSTNNEYADSAILINNTTGLATNPGASIRVYHQRFSGSNDPLRVFEVNYLGNIGLGDTDATTSGTGITFPATQSASSNANTLDDYEEGTWTPTIAFGGSSTGITYTEQVGRYTKVGRLITLQFSVTLSNKGTATGSALVGGVPALAYALITGGSRPLEAGSVQNESGGSSWPANSYGLVWTDGNVYLRYNDGTTYTGITNSNFTNTTSIYMTVTYETA
ncbi:hypothetical protein EBZ38_16865, partial [bacterium]|nr:hypothetical protein [bacterium]